MPGSFANDGDTIKFTVGKTVQQLLKRPVTRIAIVDGDIQGGLYAAETYQCGDEINAVS